MVLKKDGKKMILVLYSVKDYCKKHKITDAAVRKSIKNGKLLSVVVDELTYIIVESNELETCKNKAKLLLSKNRELKNKLLLYTKQDEKIEKLEARIEFLEAKLDKQIEQKENLYEKVIGQYNQLLEHKEL